MFEPNYAQSLPTQQELKNKDFHAYSGKVLRLNLDGSIPRDNPSFNGVTSHVYTLGHRNPQGLAFAPNGKLLQAEQYQILTMKLIWLLRVGTTVYLM